MQAGQWVGPAGTHHVLDSCPTPTPHPRYINHNLYWAVMCRPEPGAPNAPSSDLLERISKSFGSLDNFKAKFTATALAVFGSGYAWLLEDEQGVLRITGLSNQVKGGGQW